MSDHYDSKPHNGPGSHSAVLGPSQDEIDEIIKKSVEGMGGSTPSQYGLPEGAKELQDLIEYRNMNFSVGNIFKAAYRMGTKNSDKYELNKIIWFAQRELERISK